MAIINPLDVTLSLIPEVTFGVTPTTGATRYDIPKKASQALPVYKTNDVASDTIRPNRASNGSRRGPAEGTGSLDLRFQQATVIDTLLANAVSGTWNTGVLKAGKTDSSFSLIAKLNSTMYQINAGCIVSSFKVDAKAAGTVDSTFDFLFTGRTPSATDNALTVTAVDSATEFMGSDVTNITVAGATLVFSEISFEITQDRKTVPQLGTNTPYAISTTGSHQVKITVKALRESLAIDTAIDGTAQAVVFEIGGTGDGYRFTLPAAYGSIPYDETGDSMMVVMEFMAGWDDTEATDLKIEKL